MSDNFQHQFGQVQSAALTVECRPFSLQWESGEVNDSNSKNSNMAAAALILKRSSSQVAAGGVYVR